MAVYRVHKTRDFTVMSNHHLRDSRLSLKAKGLLSLILSLPDDWKHSLGGYVSMCSEGERAVRSALGELKECGYVVVEKLPPHKGEARFTYAYHIYESPQVGLDAQNVPLQDVDVHGEGVQNARVINTNNKDTSKGDYSGLGESGEEPSSTYDSLVGTAFSPPTVEEVRAFCAANMLDRCDAELFCAHYAAQGWMLGNGLPMADWQALARKWHIQDRNKSAAGRKPDADYSEFSAEHWERG